MIETIDREALRDLLDAGSAVHLLHSGGPAAFRRAHIPGSAAFGSVDEAAAALRPTDEVVVYGNGPDDPRPPALAEALALRGLAFTRWYRGGLEDWLAAGLPVEGADHPDSTT